MIKIYPFKKKDWKIIDTNEKLINELVKIQQCIVKCFYDRIDRRGLLVIIVICIAIVIGIVIVIVI